MIEISKINKHYTARVLKECDVEIILELCRNNPLFYEYTEAKPTKEQILDDMKATPPGIGISDKYFFGLFEREELVAVMDLVDGYPDQGTSYIGFFMMNPDYQGKHVGTAIIHEVAEYLRTIGKTAVRLAIDKGNPQSTHFWKKNGFEILFEVDVNGWTKLVAEKNLVKKELQLGFAEVDITPSKPMKLAGFYRGDSRSRGVLAPLMAQVAVWKSEGTCCLITIDSIGFTRELSNALRERVGKHLEVLPEKVMLCFSHTHAAPDADEERDYYEEVSNKIEECVSKAKENLSTVSVGWDNGEAKIGVNRRWISEDTDDRIGILKICDEQTKRPKLLILRVTAHGNVLKRDNYMVSPDYFGDVRMVAGQRFRCPVMVIQGAAGSTAPKYFCSQETPVDAQSEQCMRSKDALVEMANLIVESVSEKFDAIIPNKELAVHMYTEHIELISDVPSREKALHIAEDAKILCGIEDTGWLEKVASLNMTGVQEQREDVEMQFFSIGDWCMCGGPYEFMVGFALDAARILQNKFFYLNGYTNGCLLYFPTEEEFEAGGYEVFWSMLIYYRYLDRVYPFRREESTKLIRFVMECWKRGQ